MEQGGNIGKMGLERLYDSYLRGVNGVGYVEVDAMGRRKKHDRG
jgi:cell division protein FtsI/penicillin-binding protein 2